MESSRSTSSSDLTDRLAPGTPVKRDDLDDTDQVSNRCVLRRPGSLLVDLLGIAAILFAPAAESAYVSSLVPFSARDRYRRRGARCATLSSVWPCVAAYGSLISPVFADRCRS